MQVDAVPGRLAGYCNLRIVGAKCKHTLRAPFSRAALFETALGAATLALQVPEYGKLAVQPCHV